MKKIRFVILSIFVSGIFNVSISQTDTVEIILFHTNDIHAKIDNLSKLNHIVKDYRQTHENVFLISAGDLFTGNPIVDQHEVRGLPMIELMNTMDYDISCFGNHEFDYGQKELNHLMNIAEFPFICANINTSGQSEMRPVKPYTKLYTKDSLSIGLMGLIQIEDNDLPASNPNNFGGLTFDDPHKTVKKFKTYKDSSDIFILLSHVGFEDDMKMAEKNKFFDLIIGGHTHTKLETGKTIGNTLIVQADAHLDYAGMVTIKTVNRKIVSKEACLIDLDAYTEKDNEVNDKIKKYNAKDLFKQVIGVAEEDIKGKDELGSLMTDAMQDTLKTDVSFTNEGGIRLKVLPKGDITIKQIYQLSPFGNTFVVMQLKPKQIKKLIAYAYAIENANDLQVSGISIDLFLDQNNKLKKISLKDTNGELPKSKTYSVAVNNYMAAFYDLGFIKKGIDTGVNDAQSIMHFITKKKSINYKEVKRINLIK
jgi:2',3'-cyclic-nucleotide 2'-phosphodiesterase (5'-nucleotidase family)